MSVVGIDFGNANCVVACVRRGIEILANEGSRRETATVVGFKDNVRSLGETGSAQVIGNLKNSILNIKRLLGRKFSEKSVQEELNGALFTALEAADGSVEVEVFYDGKKQVFGTEQLAAMMLTNLRKTVEASTGQKSKKDVVIAVPGYYTQAQRRAMRDAAQIAGLNCLKLISEPAALALHYASKIWKASKEQQATSEARRVMFIDLGQSSLTVSIASFEQAKCKLIATVFEPSIGGRDFDQLLVRHFCEEFSAKYKLDIASNPKAMYRLDQACEKAKNILTVNSLAQVSVDSIMNDIDVKGQITRDQFEALAVDLLGRVKLVLQEALQQANLPSAAELFSVETAGCARIPCFYKACEQVLGREVSHTLNKSESVAHGATLQCAMLSPQCMVRDLSLQDINTFPIRVSWTFQECVEGPALEAGDSAILFPKNSPIPSAKKITFNKPLGVKIDVSYEPDSLPEGSQTHICSLFVPAPKPSLAIESAAEISPPKLEVKLHLDQDGLVQIEYAQVVESYVEKMDATKETTPSETVVEPMSDENLQQQEQQQQQQQQQQKKKKEEDDEKKRRKIKRTPSPFTIHSRCGLDAERLNQFAQRETEMQHRDALIFATAEVKNSLEAYVYDMRNKLQFEGCELYAFATESERESLLSAVDQTEAWLYGDGEDTTKEVYEERLSSLKSVGDSIEMRRSEFENRPSAIEHLMTTIASLRADVNEGAADRYSHIDPIDLQKILNALNEASEKLDQKCQRQKELTQTANPTLLVNELRSEAQRLQNLAKPILSKPKPKPAPAPAPAPADASSPNPEGSTSATTAESSPIETPMEDA